MLDTLREFFHKYRDLEVLVRLAGYPGLIGIVFAETGLLVGFFLPGDSLLFTSGFLASIGVMDVRILLLALSIAAVSGDQVGFILGRKAGAALYRREDSRFFKRKHLIAAHEFYEKYGGKTIFLARFVPIIRTFAPTVAGAAQMDYRKFVFFNVAGGISWVFSMVGGGFLLGQSFPGLKKHIEVVILGIIFVSVLPIAWEIWKSKREKAALPGPEGPAEG